MYVCDVQNRDLTAKGSACSQLIEEPHEDFLTASCNDSGTQNMIKATLRMDIPAARRITSLSPPALYSMMKLPRLGLITRLAANVADT